MEKTEKKKKEKVKKFTCLHVFVLFPNLIAFHIVQFA